MSDKVNNEWKKVKLGEVAEINKRSIDKIFPHKKIEYIDISSVASGVLLETKKYDLKEAPGRAKRLLNNEDTILSTVRPNRRSFLYIKHPKENLVVSTGFAVLTPTNNIDSRFLYYVVTNQQFTDYLTLHAKGAAYPAVDTETITRAEISLPSLYIQRKIASILSAYDDLIENNTRRIKILEEMAQAIYKEWFVNFRFPGHEKVKMVESDLGLIPDGWEVKKIGDRFTTVLGGTPSRTHPEYWINGNIPWINSGKVNELRIIDESEYITELGLKKSSTKLMPKRTTVIAITGATLGQVSLLEIEACANQSVVGIYDKQFTYSEYTYLTFCEIIKEIIMSAGGGAQQHINKEIVNDTTIIIPPISLIKNFNLTIRPIFDLIASLLFKNKILLETRDLLLPKLIGREIDVENLNMEDSINE